MFHFHVDQIGRSAGRSSVAAAAYRAGEKLRCEYDGIESDYTRKDGVICSGILLPPLAPPEYTERETLWNAVEKVERRKDAQLAYSFDIAFQNEFSLEENIALMRQFLMEQFVNRGMICDFAVHVPDKKGGIQNPHFHVLCPIRPLEQDGKWGAKQRRVYRLDEHGKRIPDGKGGYQFDAVPTTDWGRPETLEHWRESWATLCNARFAEKGLDCRIDNRSNAKQGKEELPSVHEGPKVRKMEARGIRTSKGELNRWIRKTNEMIKALKAKIADLSGWLKSVREELDRPQSPLLSNLLGDYYGIRNAGAYSNKAKVNNLKEYAAAMEFLSRLGIATLDDLENYLAGKQDAIDGLRDTMRSQDARQKELKELLRMTEMYKANKSAYDELCSIKFKKNREAFERDHDSELRQFYMAQRKLKAHFTSDGKLPLSRWRSELTKLETARTAAYEQEYRPLREEVRQLSTIQRHIDEVRRREAQQTQRKKPDVAL